MNCAMVVLETLLRCEDRWRPSPSVAAVSQLRRPSGLLTFSLPRLIRRRSQRSKRGPKSCPFARRNESISLLLASCWDGPTREARFKRTNPGNLTDGGVHDLFTISGMKGAEGCVLQQPDFEGELARKNVIFRFQRRYLEPA